LGQEQSSCRQDNEARTNHSIHIDSTPRNDKGSPPVLPGIAPLSDFTPLKLSDAGHPIDISPPDTKNKNSGLDLFLNERHHNGHAKGKEGLNTCGAAGKAAPSRIGPTNDSRNISMMMNTILWPKGYEPGFTENFASNEVIVAGLSAADVWPLLAEPAMWPTYYANSANVRFYDSKGPKLSNGNRFYFETFGFPVEALCNEYVPPAADQPGRVAWHGWAGEEGTNERLDVHHAWLIEDLDGGRVRILTQETQKGTPALQLAASKPNPMINGHQDWLDGLIAAAHRAKGQ